MKRHNRWLPYLAMTGIFALMVIAFAFAFFLTGWLYARVGWNPAPWLAQVINSVLGLLLIGASISVLARVFGEKQRAMQMGIFGPIVDALGRIAQGDFTVRLDDDIHQFRGEDAPVGMLVKSVNALAQELNQMEEMRQEFISNVSHEIQSPLTSIRGFAHALQDDNLSLADRKHYSGIIEMESMRLSKLSENMLALATLDADSYTLETQPYRVDQQIRNLVLASEPQWQAKALDVELAAEPITLSGNQDLLGQVWLNLLHNSIKFTPEYGKICIDLHRDSDAVTFRISDSGMGISETDQEHIFERFFKADRARERARGGSGLGLAIAKKIVELHHGTIGVVSAPDKGSTFSVSLPIAT